MTCIHVPPGAQHNNTCNLVLTEFLLGTTEQAATLSGDAGADTCSQNLPRQSASTGVSSWNAPTHARNSCLNSQLCSHDHMNIAGQTHARRVTHKPAHDDQHKVSAPCTSGTITMHGCLHCAHETGHCRNTEQTIGTLRSARLSCTPRTVTCRLRRSNTWIRI